MSGTVVDAGIIRARLAEVRANIDAALERGGRKGERVKIVVAGKYYSPPQISALQEAGVKFLGENRLQDLVEKQNDFGDDFEWHFIGHLQRRKAKDVVQRVNLIHSIDSVKLLEELEKHAPEAGIDVLLQINVSEEGSKYGIGEEEVEPLLEVASRMGGVRMRGLMAIAPLVEDAEKVRYVFARLRVLRDRLVDKWGSLFDLSELSMGMSGDYEVAVEEGATMVRIGSILVEEGEPARRRDDGY